MIDVADIDRASPEEARAMLRQMPGILANLIAKAAAEQSGAGQGVLIEQIQSFESVAQSGSPIVRGRKTVSAQIAPPHGPSGSPQLGRATQEAR